jgi:microcin C transport system ATP-binding protein
MPSTRERLLDEQDLPMNEKLLVICDLSVAFGQGAREVLAVDRVSFDIGEGETVALVGESGSGKSVTALSVMKLLPYPAAHHPSGSVTFKGRELLTMDERDIRKVRGNDITIIFQEPMTSLNPLHTIEKQIGEILLLHQWLTGEAARARIVELLTHVGIPDPRGRLASFPHQLSGGQRQRVMIAMALANEPDLLIADEPTTALDVTVQAQILKLLKDTQTRLGMSMLFITHDLGIVRKLADRVCVMQNGKIVERGAVERVFTAPEHPYTRALLAAEPKPDPATPHPEAPVVVATDNLKVWFPIKRGVLRKIVGHIKAVDGISLEVRKGETLGVVGESGSGKTTLGLAILRLISSQGPVVFMGDTIQGLKFKQMRPYRRDMQIVFQDPYGSLSPRMSVSDIIEEGLWVHHPHLTAGERTRRVIAALTDVGLDPDARFRFPHEYSGGQRQRIALARALVLEPTFIVLDEPTSALDMLIQSQMVDLLRDLQKKRDLTYMFISHDLRVVAALASRLLVLRNGKMVEEGAAADLFKSPRSDYTRALFAAAFKLETAPEGVVAQ